ncbi:MAG TPA: hypothetical protein PK812_03030 [Beijerinckiaceae bacterium]|nr:hypothetical protein [Beijerinckiaceae bacterium]
MRIKSIFAKTAIATAFGFGVALGSITLADELPLKPAGANAQNQKATKVAAVPPAVAAAAKVAQGSNMRIVVVEWKIKKGREQEFLDYWAERSTIPNRDGLVAEFLSTVDSKEKWPWINWLGPIDKPGITTFYNVGLWRDGESFQDNIGKFIDNNRPPLDFEGEKRTRVFLAPQRWRVGETRVPAKDSDGTK